ncbi:MAG: excinuclease ABC subunit UvrA [Candidatus Omnitrophota bacterium]
MDRQLFKGIKSNIVKDSIVINGAKEHNLKNIKVVIPRNSLTVITGLSGSGKSSLAFDTIYAEGQRRYIESLSAYARQFLQQLQKPNIESIEGISATIAIEQRSASSNPRSIVATQTEIYDYLRLLFARIGRPFCHKCAREIKSQSSEEIIEQVITSMPNSIISIFAPVIRGKKGHYRSLLEQIRKDGFSRVRIDKKEHALGEDVALDRYKIHTIEIFIDRLKVQAKSKDRLADSIEMALKIGGGTVIILKENARHESIFSEQYACVHCGESLGEIQPRFFSFNSPYGACPACNGLGTKLEFDPDLIIPDKSKSIAEGAVAPWKKGGRSYLMYYRALLRELARELDFSLNVPFRKLPQSIRKAILYGVDIHIWGKPFEGIIPHLTRLFSQTKSDFLKGEISRFMSVLACPECFGARLKKESLSVKIAGLSIWDVCQFSIKEAKKFFDNLKLSSKEAVIGMEALKEIRNKLNFCINVGLDYLTLERKSSTLSGGEAQRIRLATQIGSGLVGVIYILDEPSIGLHQRDNRKLIKSLLSLRDLGNTVIVVEHDETTIRSSDFIVDLGPQAGAGGGYLIYSGGLPGLLKSKKSLTAKFLNGELRIQAPGERRIADFSKALRIEGACEHNLKKIDVNIPLGVFNCVSGLSGSGKSTLIYDILYKALASHFYNSKEKAGKHSKISGLEFIDKVIIVDQAPIGRTPRSNPATYTGVFAHIREVFSRLPLSRARGYKPGRFSFNVKGGRCEACLGDGIKKIEMHFLPDVYVHCEVCKGTRFNQQTLEVRFKGNSISDCLNLCVSEARELFANIPKIKRILDTLSDVGLGYIQLGQFATTLSGGEAQRIKLSEQLSKRSSGRTLYLLDEPTTGLHFADVDKLLDVLHRLVDAGNTVLVIEHNLDVLKSCDYIIDLGPEGGDAGGEVVACGSPEEIIASLKSYTGIYLKKALRR